MNKTVILALTVSALIPVLTCCSSQTGYRTFKGSNSMCSISFDYPTQYRIDEGGLDFGGGKVCWLALLTPEVEKTLKVPNVEGTRKDETVNVQLSEIDVNIWTPHYSIDCAETMLDFRIAEESRRDQFELLKREPTTVSGIQGERIHYLVNARFQSPEAPPLDCKSIVCFDYGELIWEIKMTCCEDLVESTKADYEHVLQTFKILEP